MKASITKLLALCLPLMLMMGCAANGGSNHPADPDYGQELTGYQADAHERAARMEGSSYYDK